MGLVWASSAAAAPAPLRFAPFTSCRDGTGVSRPCLLGEFRRGLSVRVLGAPPGCAARTSGPAIFSFDELPTDERAQASLLRTGGAQRATLLELTEGCTGTVAAVGFAGQVERLAPNPVAEGATRSRFAARASTSEAAREVIRKDGIHFAMAPEAEPAAVFTFSDAGPTFVKLRSRYQETATDGPVVVFEGERLVTPYALCTGLLEAYRIAGRVYVHAMTGQCETGGVVVLLHELRGGRLVKVLATPIFAD